MRLHQPKGRRSISDSGASEIRPAAARRPEISVVVPAFNREGLIGEALQSVGRQTVPVAELIVVDDGSTDGTALVAERCGARVMRQANRGVSAARNTGVRAASHAWIAFLDSDDLWEPEKIELQCRALEECPGAGLVFTDMTQFDDTGVVVPSFLAERPAFRDVRRTAVTDGIARCDRQSLAGAYLRENFINPSTLLARRDLLLQAGLFDLTFGHCEDRDLCLRLLALTEAAVVERPLVRYRLHPTGASTDKLKMVLGAATVAERVFARPERYPDGALAYYRKVQPGQLREAGLLLMEEGRFDDARAVLARSLHGRFIPRTLVAYLASLGGRPTYQAMVGLKRKLGLPGVR